MTLHDSSLASVCVVGLGMIGGSFAQALRQRGHKGPVTAWVRNDATARDALENSVVDSVSRSIHEAVRDADVVMLAVPMLAMESQLEAIATSIRADTVVTDAGSVKQPFIEAARRVFGGLERVVPGHPIAGSERTGVGAANAALYEDRRVILTPVEETSSEAIRLVSDLWECTGAEVEILDAAHHDRVLAATSHLPHVLAFALVDTLATQQEAEEIFRFAAGGFRDFTRIASSDAIMWRDICLSNQDAVCASIDALDTHLQRLRTAIHQGDADAIEAIFRRARAARDAHVLPADPPK